MLMSSRSVQARSQLGFSYLLTVSGRCNEIPSETLVGLGLYALGAHLWSTTPLTLQAAKLSPSTDRALTEH
jgi:hypothetical protein